MKPVGNGQRSSSESSSGVWLTGIDSIPIPKHLFAHRQNNASRGRRIISLTEILQVGPSPDPPISIPPCPPLEADVEAAAADPVVEDMSIDIDMVMEELIFELSEGVERQSNGTAQVFECDKNFVALHSVYTIRDLPAWKIQTTSWI